MLTHNSVRVAHVPSVMWERQHGTPQWVFAPSFFFAMTSRGRVKKVCLPSGAVCHLLVELARGPLSQVSSVSDCFLNLIKNVYFLQHTENMPVMIFPMRHHSFHT